MKRDFSSSEDMQIDSLFSLRAKRVDKFAEYDHLFATSLVGYLEIRAHEQQRSMLSSVGGAIMG